VTSPSSNTHHREEDATNNKSQEKNINNCEKSLLSLQFYIFFSQEEVLYHSVPKLTLTLPPEIHEIWGTNKQGVRIFLIQIIIYLQENNG